MESKNHAGFCFHSYCDCVLSDHIRSAGSLQLVDGALAMFLLAGILALCLLIYLFLALLWPERFG
jgi:K+-transporting ATPase KdpF subunit